MSGVWLVVLAALGLAQGHLLPSENFTEQQLRHYFTNYKSHTQKIHSFCLYINVNAHRDISDWFIKHNSCSSVLPGNLSEVPDLFPQTDATFIFLRTYLDVSRVIAQLREYRFWNPSGENHFILCEPFTNADILPELLRLIWKQHIINFVFVVVSGGLEIYSYDGFRKGITNLSERPGCFDNLFSDELGDLEGYQLRVSLFEQVPLIMKYDGEWYGEDYRMLELVTSAMNASFRIVEPHNNQTYVGSYKNLINDDADFCFNSFFMAPDLFRSTVDYTYPHSYNKFVVLMPVTPQDYKEKTHNILSIFAPSVWALIIVLVVTTAITVTAAINWNWFALPEYLLYSLSSLLGYAFFGLNTKPFCVKFQLITFILGSLILRTGFNCFLMSGFMSPYKSDKITTIEELKRSKIGVYMAEDMTPDIPEEFNLHGSFIDVTREELFDRLYSMDKTVAYVLSEAIVDNFFRWVKNYQQTVPFYVVKEPLLLGYDVYILQKHSPYVKKVNKLVLQGRENVLLNNYEIDRRFYPRNGTVEDRLVVLTMGHISSIFYVLIGGLAASCLIFLGELFYKTLTMEK
jgi:hypothetical protein